MTEISITEALPHPKDYTPQEGVPDVPVAERSFEMVDPNLDGPAELYAWDDEKKRRMVSTIRDFGSDLAEVEKSGARLEYPEHGHARIDFSACQQEREKLFGDLKARIEKILGPEDAERLMILSGMQGLATPLLPYQDVKMSRGRNSLSFEMTGVGSVHMNLEGRRHPITMKMVQGGSTFDRIRHLGFELDAGRLLPADQSVTPEAR